MRPDRYHLRPDFEISEPQIHGSLQTVEVIDDKGKVYNLDTYSVDGSDEAAQDQEVELIFEPWSDYVARPFMQRRLDMIAEIGKKRVISVDNPGIGVNTDGLGVRRGFQLARGDWSRVSDLQWQAIQANETYRSASIDKLTLSYFSLGASAAAAMAAYAPEGTKVNEILLWESVALKKMSFARLAHRYLLHGGDNWQQYMDENPDWVPEPSSNFKAAMGILSQPVGHVAYPAAMAKGPIDGLLKQAYDKEVIDRGTLIQIANGSASIPSPTDENDALADRLREFPVDGVRRIIFEGETHGVNDSFRRVAQALGYFSLR